VLSEVFHGYILPAEAYDCHVVSEVFTKYRPIDETVGGLATNIVRASSTVSDDRVMGGRVRVTIIRPTVMLVKHYLNR